MNQIEPTHRPTTHLFQQRPRGGRLLLVAGVLSERSAQWGAQGAQEDRQGASRWRKMLVGSVFSSFFWGFWKGVFSGSYFVLRWIFLVFVLGFLFVRVFFQVGFVRCLRSPKRKPKRADEEIAFLLFFGGGGWLVVRRGLGDLCFCMCFWANKKGVWGCFFLGGGCFCG